MIANLLMLVPGAGPFLAAGWRLLSTPAGRRIVIFTAGIAASFGFGWSLKARLDRSATLQAVIAKQRIDLRAARDTAERRQRHRGGHREPRRQQSGDHP